MAISERSVSNLRIHSLKENQFLALPETEQDAIYLVEADVNQDPIPSNIDIPLGINRNTKIITGLIFDDVGNISGFTTSTIQHPEYHISGSSTFTGSYNFDVPTSSTGRVISLENTVFADKTASQYHVFITPTSLEGSGDVGEIIVVKNTGQFTVFRTGGSTGTFDYLVTAAVAD